MELLKSILILCFMGAVSAIIGAVITHFDYLLVSKRKRILSIMNDFFLYFSEVLLVISIILIIVWIFTK